MLNSQLDDIEAAEPDWDNMFSGLSDTNFLSDTFTESLPIDFIHKNNFESNINNSSEFPIIPENLPNDIFHLDVNMIIHDSASFVQENLNKKVPNVLNEFLDMPKRPKKIPRKEPKKEYYRIKLIRGHKRALRALYLRRIPTKTINKLVYGKIEQQEAWSIFESHFFNNHSILQQLSSTANGPLTDGKSKLQRMHQKKTLIREKTFNNTYCEDYFSEFIVKESFILYIDYLCKGSTPKELCEKFGFFCCKGEHNDECEIKWEKLCVYSKTSLCSSRIDRNYIDQTGEIEYYE